LPAGQKPPETAVAGTCALRFIQSVVAEVYGGFAEIEAPGVSPVFFDWASLRRPRCSAASKPWGAPVAPYE
jgi:hypothetical protein